MNRQIGSHVGLGLFLGLCCLIGCAFNTHGNRDDERRLITHSRQLPRFVGNAVTLVGTARSATGGDGGDAAIDLRGGSVALPAYEWPSGYADQPVAVTGTLFEQRTGRSRVYRLGEIQGAQRWSR